MEELEELENNDSMLSEVEEFDSDESELNCLRNGVSFTNRNIYKRCCSRAARIKGRFNNRIYYECY